MKYMFSLSKKSMLSLSFYFVTLSISAQNVGIGEANPNAAKLQVKTADSAVGLLHNSTTSGNNVKTALYFKTGSNYSGSVGTVGSGATFRMGLFTFGGLFPSDLKERVSITDGGNVGVDTITPSAKFDVNGDMNVQGQMKLKGDAGSVGDVLTKNSSNQPEWVAGKTEFKNSKIFRCNTFPQSSGPVNCSFTFTVPAGVTKLLVEGWGGGGGGGENSSGGAGGYVKAALNTSPGTVINLTVGGGGLEALINADGQTGGNTQISHLGQIYNALGGSGGDFENLPNTGSNILVAGGGGWSANTDINVTGAVGEPGGLVEVSYFQASATEYIKQVKHPNGGRPYPYEAVTSKGGTSITSSVPANSYTIYGSSVGGTPGAGGCADVLNGDDGRAGQIIIYY